MYTFHFTFDGQEAVQALGARYRDRLVGLPDLVLVPDRWLHLTTQGLAFTDEIISSEVQAVVSAAAERVRESAPVQAVIGPARVTAEALLLDVSPPSDLANVRAAIRDAIAAVRGRDKLGEGDEWVPHVSVAYSSGTGSADPYVKALAVEDAATCLIDSVELIELNRDNYMYKWQTVARLPLAADAGS
jgi:hypothetical protein